MVEPDAEIQNWTHSALEKKSSGSNACGDVTPHPLGREGGGRGGDRPITSMESTAPTTTTTTTTTFA